jgi:hypothetical protein
VARSEQYPVDRPLTFTCALLYNKNTEGETPKVGTTQYPTDTGLLTMLSSLPRVTLLSTAQRSISSPN